MGQTDQPRTVDRTDQAYRAWLDDETVERRDHFEKRKRGLNAERRQARAGLTTPDLFRMLLEREGRLSAAPAGAIEPGRGGGDENAQPTPQLPEDDPVYRERWRVIRSAVERLHELLDAAEGHTTSEARDLTTEEKDRKILVEGRGYSYEAVVDLLGRDIAGSARTVWRKRKSTHDPDSREFKLLGFAVRTSDGEPVEELAQLVRKPGVRRVQVDQRDS